MMLVIGTIIVSTIVFGLMTADMSWQNILVGFGLSSGVLLLFRKEALPKPLPPTGFATQVILTSPLLAWYLLIDIIKGTWMVLTTTLGLRPLRQPGIVKMSIAQYSPYGVGPVGYFITLSPGSFMVDVDWEAREMLVHVLDASDPDQVRADAEKYYRLWARKETTQRPEDQGGDPHA